MELETLGTLCDQVLLVDVVPWVPRLRFETLDGFFGSHELEGVIFDTRTDRCPRQASPPEFQLAVADTVFEEVSWIELICMPYHNHIFNIISPALSVFTVARLLTEWR